jgi:hypothetical protein
VQSARAFNVVQIVPARLHLAVFMDLLSLSLNLGGVLDSRLQDRG